MAFFTICSKNFLAYARTLHASLRVHYPDTPFFVALCDQLDGSIDLSKEPFEIIELDKLAIPDLQEMAHRYNITEFNTAIKPFVFSYLFKVREFSTVIYFDPDILVMARLVELDRLLNDGAEAVLTPHILEPAENVEVHDQKMLMFGIYNLGFLALRNTGRVREIVDWWGRRLQYQCVIKLEEGLFTDQKWVDLFPAFIPGCKILHHPGYNVAYWNLSQRKVTVRNGVWFVNDDQLLRFVHLSGHRLDDPTLFSRHCAEHTLANIGDLSSLVSEYRQKVYANNHEFYGKLPYAFSWNGANGVNLHTPQTTGPFGNIAVSQSPVSAVQRCWRLVRTASRLSGGWIPLVKKTVGVLMKGKEAIRENFAFVQSYTGIMAGPAKPRDPDTGLPEWVPQLLFIDWSTPRTDQDAGSLTAFHLLKIYVELGYNVTFIPSDLQYLGEYTEAVRKLGVRTLHREDIGTVSDHLQIEGRNYDFVLLCRAPIAALYIGDIRHFAPKAKIIINTSDLHYLRDIREAEIDGTEEKINAAQQAKKWELDILRRCDTTIVMSSFELEILKNELPKADIRLIPLMFVEPIHESHPFEDRQDFLFIGGFPHLPNVDAVVNFCGEILPLVRKSLPEVTFHIVGNKPPPEVLALGALPGVIVHGYVKDIDPLFRKIRLSVAPLRYGAGIKGKIGTSLSYGVPVVATSIAVEGMEIEQGVQVLVADGAEQFADAIVTAYNSRELWTRLSENGRDQMLKTYSPAAGQRRISRLMQDVNPRHKQLDLYELRSYQEYVSLVRALGTDLRDRVAVELGLVKHEQQNFLINGFCAICGCESSFNTSFMYSYETTEDGRPIPNWREHLDCRSCHQTNRIRAAMHMFSFMVRPSDDAAIYITEQTTPLFKWLKIKHPKIVGSEYFGEAVPLGSMKDGLRNEDLTKLTFADNSFDHILSFDVLEHVTDDIAALSEVYRCLKPGGTFLFSAPFAKNNTEKVVRARMGSDGSIEHILPPEYHGNPVDHENGALCFQYLAWDLLTDMKSIGFHDPRVLHYWSRDFAYLGGEQFLFLGQKPL